MPLDPIETATGDSPRNTPEFIDENPNRDLVLEGMDLSDEERREAAADVYGEDPSLQVSDELDGGDDEVAPEIAAMHYDQVPEDL
jgi:hypothetical protein